jgi:phosphatidylserine/phosphatidylglycerophosphate/cardiolipin synthase-like enzyme
VLFIGKVTEKIKTSFEEYWNNDLSVPYSSLVRKKKKNEDPQRFNKIHNYVCDEKNFPPSMRERLKNFTQTLKTAADSGKLFVVNEVSYVADEPGKNKHKTNRKGGVCTDSLLALLKEAKHTVDIQTSYLITTDEGKKLLAELVKRGIRVRILTNSLASVDNFEAFSGYKRDRKKTLATGIEIYEFKPDAKIRYQLMIDEVQSAINYSAVYGFHSKSMVIDGKTSVIGSFNLDPRSANLNTECIAIFRSPEVAQHLSSFIEEEFSPENSWRITKDFNPDKKAGMKKRVKVAWRRIFPKVFL